MNKLTDTDPDLLENVSNDLTEEEGELLVALLHKLVLSSDSHGSWGDKTTSERTSYYIGAFTHPDNPEELAPEATTDERRTLLGYAGLVLAGPMVGSTPEERMRTCRVEDLAASAAHNFMQAHVVQLTATVQTEKIKAMGKLND